MFAALVILYVTTVARRLARPHRPHPGRGLGRGAARLRRDRPADPGRGRRPGVHHRADRLPGAAASSSRWPADRARSVLAMLFLAEFGSGLGVMILDISAGSLIAAIVPNRLRARVAGVTRTINYGIRPIGALAGGALGTALGVRPTLWVATIGALAGVLWMIGSPVVAHARPAAASSEDEPAPRRRVARCTCTAPAIARCPCMRSAGRGAHRVQVAVAVGVGGRDIDDSRRRRGPCRRSRPGRRSRGRARSSRPPRRRRCRRRTCRPRRRRRGRRRSGRPGRPRPGRTPRPRRGSARRWPRRWPCPSRRTCTGWARSCRCLPVPGRVGVHHTIGMRIHQDEGDLVPVCQGWYQSVDMRGRPPPGATTTPGWGADVMTRLWWVRARNQLRQQRRQAVVVGVLGVGALAMMVLSWWTAEGSREFFADLWLNVGAGLAITLATYIVLNPLFRDLQSASIVEHARPGPQQPGRAGRRWPGDRGHPGDLDRPARGALPGAVPRRRPHRAAQPGHRPHPAARPRLGRCPPAGQGAAPARRAAGHHGQPVPPVPAR